MKSWALSVALHGTVLGLAVALWPETPPEPEPEPFRWNVAFTRQAVSAPAPIPPARPEPAPPAKKLPPQPAPLPLAPLLPATHAPTPIATAVALPPASAATSVAPANTAEAADLNTIVSPVPPPPVPPPPAPAAPPQAGPPGDALAAEAERLWQAAFLAQLRQLKRYPLVARRLGQEGVAVLDLRVDAQGRLESLEIRRYSGHPLLDQDALRLVREAADSTQPSLAPGRATRLEIPIVYRLRDG